LNDAAARASVGATALWVWMNAGNMPPAYEVQVSRALDLHRSGHVAAASAIYQRLLLEHEDDANLIGLLGVVAVQEGRRDEAEGLWRRSLGLACAAPVYIRNINNLAATLFEDGRNGEAAQLLEHAVIPPWSGIEAPDEQQLESILSLAMCLRRVKLTKTARAMLEPVGALLPDNKDVQTLQAACRIADEDFAAALDILQRFAGADDLWTLTARLHCERMLGREAEAEADHRQALQRASVYVGDDVRADRKTVLVINSGDGIMPVSSVFELHFSGNYPSQLAEVLKDDFNFISVFGDSEFVKLDGLKPNVVLNNIVNAEVLSRDDTFKHKLSALVDSFGVPVINHPLQAALTTRQRIAFGLKDLDNVVVPKTIRFAVDGGALESQANALEVELGYPLIIRTIFNQRGVGMEKVDDRRGLTRELAARIGDQIYAHAFVDSRAGEPYYRKFRVAVVGDQIVPVRLDFGDSWKVHGRIKPERKLFYRQRRHLLDVEKRILAPPNDILTEGAMQALRDLRKKIPLDIFGVDFDVAPDGRILFFEANASMYLLEYLGPDDADLFRPAAATARATAAIKAYLERKCAG
jgi:hypothetical protein